MSELKLIAVIENMELWKYRKHDRTEMKIVESFDKHYILLLLPFIFARKG